MTKRHHPHQNNQVLVQFFLQEGQHKNGVITHQRRGERRMGRKKKFTTKLEENKLILKLYISMSFIKDGMRSEIFQFKKEKGTCKN